MEGIAVVAKKGTTYAIGTCLIIVVTARVHAVGTVATCFDIVVITSVHAVVAKEGACLVAAATRLLIAVTACAPATIAMSSVAKEEVTCVAAATCFVIVFATCFCDVVAKEKVSDYPHIITMPKYTWKLTCLGVAAGVFVVTWTQHM